MTRGAALVLVLGIFVFRPACAQDANADAPAPPPPPPPPPPTPPPPPPVVPPPVVSPPVVPPPVVPPPVVPAAPVAPPPVVPAAPVAPTTTTTTTTGWHLRPCSPPPINYGLKGSGNITQNIFGHMKVAVEQKCMGHWIACAYYHKNDFFFMEVLFKLFKNGGIGEGKIRNHIWEPMSRALDEMKKEGFGLTAPKEPCPDDIDQIWPLPRSKLLMAEIRKMFQVHNANAEMIFQADSPKFHDIAAFIAEFVEEGGAIKWAPKIKEHFEKVLKPKQEL